MIFHSNFIFLACFVLKFRILNLNYPPVRPKPNAVLQYIGVRNLNCVFDASIMIIAPGVGVFDFFSANIIVMHPG